MNTEVITAEGLVRGWQEVREDFKLDGYRLSADETAGMLIEQLGSYEAALRLVASHNMGSMMIRLERPKNTDWREVERSLWRAWPMDNQLPTFDELHALWQNRPHGTTPAGCADAKMLAGYYIEVGAGDVNNHINRIGLSLYSPMHFVDKELEHPLMQDAFFWLMWATT